MYNSERDETNKKYVTKIRHIGFVILTERMIVDLRNTPNESNIYWWFSTCSTHKWLYSLFYNDTVTNYDVASFSFSVLVILLSLIMNRVSFLQHNTCRKLGCLNNVTVRCDNTWSVSKLNPVSSCIVGGCCLRSETKVI